MHKSSSNVAQMWKQELASGGYEGRVTNWFEYLNAIRLTRTWKKIFKVVKLKPGTLVFEFGCGGGKHLVPLAARGYRCFGIDCSKEVIERCKNFIHDAEKYSKGNLNINIYEGDFASFNLNETYDLVFNFGVIEHFLDRKERISLLKKMFNICKSGGYVVSVVPSGVHPLREKMKTKKLGGYSIPEIDYSPELMIQEMKEVGAEDIKVLPHNLFGYLLIDNKVSFLTRIFNKSFYLFLQLLPEFMTRRAFKHSFSLICIGRKNV